MEINEKSADSIIRQLFALPLLCFVAAFTLATVNEKTKETILLQKERAALDLLNEIFPPQSYDNDLLAAEFELPEQLGDQLNHERQQKDSPSNSSLHRAFRFEKNGKVIGVTLPSIAKDGYNGTIELLVGLRNTDPISLQAVRVIAHSETPGLGDKIERTRSDWILSFNGASLAHPPAEDWEVLSKGGVYDAFTGATITPSAVTRQLADTLAAAQNHRELLFFSAP